MGENMRLQSVLQIFKLDLRSDNTVRAATMLKREQNY